MTRVILVHGIRTAAGSPVVQRLIPFLEAEGFEVLYPDYGYELAIATRAVNPMLVGTLLPFMREGDYFVGHSNGCAIGYELMQRGAPIRRAAFINAALDSDIPLPAGLEHLDVYYNEGDQVTVLARLGAHLGVTDPVWGEMGHAGYTGTSERVRTRNCGLGLAPCYGHSALFEANRIPYWGPIVARSLKGEG